MSELSDEKAAEIVQNGDKEAFGIIMERYEQKMLRYARRFLFDVDNAEDMVQEVFIKAYTNIASFNTLQRFSPWIYRIAHNCFINEIRKRKREPLSFFDLDILLPHVVSAENPEKEVIDSELRHALDHCLEKIDVKYKEVLILYYCEGLSYKEIADVLHIPVNLVGIRINRGKKAMNKFIKI